MRSWIGRRVRVTDLLHSHARTRAYTRHLLGRCGVVVAVLRMGKVALVELNDPVEDCPAGARRWHFCWGDLELLEETSVLDRFTADYRAGFSWHEGRAIQHAVLPGKDDKAGVCGLPAQALPTCGWSLAFSPAVERACPTCVRLADDSDQDSALELPVAS
ncbi:hypothetical protein [Nonomuraea fuscirosea]|uniref:hypothetical protein n=1 Tax=Nonomuraea fuscirosea TaxID=1291556 RepID=UPI003417D35C